MLLMPVCDPSVSWNQGSGSAYCDGEIGGQHADRQCAGGRDGRQLDAVVLVGDLARIERVHEDAVEAEQVGQARTVHREARGAARRSAERRKVQPRPRLLVAVRTARHRLKVAAEVMSERGRLRLHPVRVEGEDRVRVFLRHCEERRARVVELRIRREERVAQHQPRRRLSKVLT